MEDDDEDENRTGEDQIDNSEMKKAKRATEEQETFVSGNTRNPRGFVKRLKSKHVV